MYYPLEYDTPHRLLYVQEALNYPHLSPVQRCRSSQFVAFLYSTFLGNETLRKVISIKINYTAEQASFHLRDTYYSDNKHVH